MGSYLLKSEKAKTNVLLLVAISFTALFTLLLFSYAHKRLDALVVILLLVATSTMFVFLCRKAC